MNRTIVIIAGLYLSLGALDAMATNTAAMKEIKEYCNSMQDEGISSEEANQLVEDCIREQSEYVQNNPEPETIDCYSQAEEIIQSKLDTDPEAETRYDELVEECLSSQN